VNPLNALFAYWANKQVHLFAENTPNPHACTSSFVFQLGFPRFLLNKQHSNDARSVTGWWLTYPSEKM